MYMTKMDDESDEQIPIPLGDTTQRRGYWGNYGFPIYSCRFSTDGKEIVAGGRKDLFVFDLGSMQRVLSISAHSDDINSCCWADTRSGNVLVSASDDTTLKVWDRRSLGKSNKPSGVLIGHTEGLTHVGPKGDGRYVISNGKDQVLRLWDLRKMRTHNEWNGGNPYGHEMFDYRDGRYPKPNFKKHPLDTSVMSYKGHAVLRTLIRCHFSPAETTGSSYIYSGSYDGKIHIWSLDGRVVQVLDRSKTLPISFHPSESDVGTRSSDRMAHVVRDVSWHSQEPILMSCAWDGEYEYAGSVARHEWKGYGRNALTIEDVVERDELNTAHAAQMALPGGLLSELRRHS
ncbi:hypothetical protein FRB99_007354 [Tulasnella sp. 403]|nr:hypothetical protein FRB99_007354 [Tulasnella sp. 403]